MKLIVGLGNVGPKYEKTRHNVGFMAVDALARKYAADDWQHNKKLFCDLTKVSIDGEVIMLAKPSLFMNLSGQSVRKLIDFYRIDPVDLMVVQDDLDLAVGTVRFKFGGGTGGHHGLDSIHQFLGTDQYCRCRIGIGKDGQSVMTEKQGADFVLKKFRQDERPVVREAIEQAVSGCQDWVKSGIEKVMNDYN